jgi:hypothetical protein
MLSSRRVIEYNLKGMQTKVGHIKLLDQHLSNEVKKNHREPQNRLPLDQYMNQGAPEYN